jgi:hypothetical protein
MTLRANLRRQIKSAWASTVSKHYVPQRINSEASLQASFWSHLDRILTTENPTDRRLFVEPSVRVEVEVPGDKSRPERRYPDLVVCSKSQIIAFIELKYVPRGKPSLTRDLEKFVWISTHKKSITIRNERFLGELEDDHKYKMSKNVLFAWCGIYKSHLKLDLTQSVPVELHKNLFTMHELTLDPPKVYS